MSSASTAARPGLSGVPVNLLVRGRRVVVVGAGRIAARKIEPLLDRGAEVVVVAPHIGDEVRGWADQGRCTVAARGRSQPADLDGAWLAYTATDDPAANRAVFAAAEERRIWANSADDPANCSFTLMSVVRRSDLVVAIGTGGRSPALASYLRRMLGEEIGPEYARCSTCCPRPGKHCGPPGVRVKTPIGSRRSVRASWTWSVPGASTRRRSS